MKKLLHNAYILNEGTRFKGYIEINEEGKIAAIGDGAPSDKLLRYYGESAHDCSGHILMPGVIDSHVHFREPGGEHKATIYTESRAAVAGGVTSFMEMPNTAPATVTAEMLADKMERAARDSVANYSFYIGATDTNLEALRNLDYNKVPGVKLFMGSSTGGMQVEEDSALAGIFSLPVLVAVHCEDEQIIRENMCRVRALYPDEQSAPASWHPQIRSALSCYTSTARAVALAKRFGTRLHVMHLTTAQELDLIREAGAKVTAEACVAHLLFTDSDYPRLGTRIKCNPAVKSALHRDALRSALASGIISTVSTDHAPHTLAEKETSLFKAPSGMPMVQFSLPAMMDLALQMNWEPELVVEKMCHNQALTFGVEERGFIRKGYFADLVELDFDGVTEINASAILSKCGWSPLEGRSLHTQVVTTWVNGHEVFTRNDGIAEAPAQAMPLTFRHG